MKLVKLENSVAMTDSKLVADTFEKVHRIVLRDIRVLIEKEPEFAEKNFILSSYISKQNKELPSYKMTKDGFALLVMGYPTRKALKFKIAYINQFNAMEKALKESVCISHKIDAAMIAYNKDKDIASYCGKQLSAWKKKRAEHTAKIEKLADDQQLCLGIFNKGQ